MKKSDGISFNAWCSIVQATVWDLTQVTFRDMDAVRLDYESDRTAQDVASEIVAFLY